MDMLQEWNECIVKPVSQELLHGAGNYVINRSFRGAMRMLMVDSELSTPSFMVLVSCFEWHLLCKRS